MRKAHLFVIAQVHAPQESVQYAWGRVTMIFQDAIPQSSGIGQKHGHGKTSKDDWPLQTDWSSVSIGSSQSCAPAHLTLKSTYVQDVGNPAMECRSVLKQKSCEDLSSESGWAPVGQNSAASIQNILEQQKKEGLTPYHPSAWAEELLKHNLSCKYLNLPESLVQGFDVRIPTINKSYTPPNNSSLNQFPDVYLEIIKNKFAKGQYLGPLSGNEVKDLIGPFQSSPLSLVSKPEKPKDYQVKCSQGATKGSNEAAQELKVL